MSLLLPVPPIFKCDRRIICDFVIRAGSSERAAEHTMITSRRQQQQQQPSAVRQKKIYTCCSSSRSRTAGSFHWSLINSSACDMSVVSSSWRRRPRRREVACPPTLLWLAAMPSGTAVSGTALVSRLLDAKERTDQFVFDLLHKQGSHQDRRPTQMAFGEETPDQSVGAVQWTH